MGTPVGEEPSLGGFAIESPAGYAFAIWGPIFLLTLIYAVRQFLPANVDRPLYRRIGWLTAAWSVLLSAWMVIAQVNGNSWVLVVIIWALLALAFMTLLRIVDVGAGLDRFDRFVTLPMAGLLTGWLSAAVWLNLSSLIRAKDPALLGLSNLQFGLGALALIVAGTWALLLRSKGAIWQGVAVTWAFVGVVVTNQSPAGSEVAALVAAIAAAMTVVLVVFLNLKLARKAAA
jgi:hypothetical protein